jgi:hypothetical protein
MGISSIPLNSGPELTGDANAHQNNRSLKQPANAICCKEAVSVPKFKYQTGKDQSSFKEEPVC